ncbi:hypothetical protein Tco_0664002 [Tanacetum coccineum]
MKLCPPVKFTNVSMPDLNQYPFPKGSDHLSLGDDIQLPDSFVIDLLLFWGRGLGTYGMNLILHRFKKDVEFRRISLTGFRSCASRSYYRSVSKQTTRSEEVEKSTCRLFTPILVKGLVVSWVSGPIGFGNHLVSGLFSRRLMLRLGGVFRGIFHRLFQTYLTKASLSILAKLNSDILLVVRRAIFGRISAWWTIPLDKGLFEEITGIDSSWGESVHPSFCESGKSKGKNSEHDPSLETPGNLNKHRC